MAKPIQTPESFTDLLFPVNGLDLSQTFDQQRLGTTPTGQNVRAFDVLRFRARGGSRPGLIRYPDDLVPLDATAAKEIQHLGVVVDPTTAALEDDQDTLDDGGDGGQGDDNLIDDPSTNNHSTRIPTGRRVRRRGSGKSPGRNKTPKNQMNGPITFNVASNGASPQTFSLAVTKGRILVLGVGSWATAGAATFGVSDDGANSWTQAGITSATNSDMTPVTVTASLWWCYVKDTTTINITVTSSNGFVSAYAGTIYTLDFRLNELACNPTQLDSTATVTGSSSPVNITVGSAIGGEALVVAALADQSGGLAIAPLAGNAGAININLGFAFNYNGQTTGFSWSGLPTTRFIAAVGATFFRVPTNDKQGSSTNGVGRLTPGNGINALGGGGGTGNVSFGKISGS